METAVRVLFPIPKVTATARVQTLRRELDEAATLGKIAFTATALEEVYALIFIFILGKIRVEKKSQKTSR